MIRKIILIILMFIIFTLPVSAKGYDVEGLYEEQYDKLDLDEIYNLIDEETEDLIDEFGFSIEDVNSSQNLSIEKVLDVLSVFFRDGIKTPIGVFVSVIGASVLIGASKAAEPNNKNFGISDIVGVSAVSISIIAPAIVFFKAIVSTIKTTATLMTGFVPIFTGILVTSGKPTTSTLTSSSLLLTAEICQQISTYVVLPFISIYMAITVASSFTDKFNIPSISSSIQKFVSICMTSVMTIFCAIISLQGIIGNSTDSASLRVFRLVAGSTPIIGGAVSEATGIVSSCINMLKNSVFIYAVICFAAFFIPIIIELLLWRLSMFCGGLVSQMLGSDKISSLVNSVGYVFGVVTSITVNTFIMFVISLTVIMVTTGGSV